MAKETKKLEVEIPEGYEIDRENSTFECIIFKKKTVSQSWEEYKRNHYGEKCFCNKDNNEIIAGHRAYEDSFPMPTEEMALAISAFCKLVQLRKEWVGDWEPNWNSRDIKYLIYTDMKFTSKALSFPTKEMRDKFFDTFRDLIEQAEMFI